jgi:hypothetical protein
MLYLSKTKRCPEKADHVHVGHHRTDRLPSVFGRQHEEADRTDPECRDFRTLIRDPKSANRAYSRLRYAIGIMFWARTPNDGGVTVA